MQENISPGQPPRHRHFSSSSAHDPHVSIALGERPNYFLFWGCFLALVTTAFGFIARMFLISTWRVEFQLDEAKAGELAGIGIWPFAVSIIGFSLFIDKIGYKVSMLIAFVGHLIWAVMGVQAFHLSQANNKELAYDLLYWGSLILGLANGTVEAFINPVVATMFNKDKTKWLNILHAGWPGGLVVAGVSTIFLDQFSGTLLGDPNIKVMPWWIKVGIIAVPAVFYFLMLLPCKFPVQERVSSGVSYREMLGEFGVLGALIVGFLVTLQLIQFFDNPRDPLSQTEKYIFVGIGAAIVLGFAIYTRSLGSLLMFFLILIMMPLATTEIGTDGWITSIMEPLAKEREFDPGWVLVYTSGIMMVMRFFAGPIVHALTPLGLLAVSSVMAIAGLVSLSYSTTAALIFGAATLYGFGKTFFWPTMLGVVSEQTPKGGALTLNAISGIGMLAVGTLGFPFIGTLQSAKEIKAVEESAVAKEVPGLIVNGKLAPTEDKKIYEIISYKSIDPEKFSALVLDSGLPDKKAEELTQVRDRSKQGALFDMAIFPTFMLVCYVILILYFQSRGGYKPVHLGAGAH
jgi:MFS family permease